MNTFTAQELAGFYQKVADGGEIEYCGSCMPIWVACPCKTRGPKINSSKDNWRIKPTKKVIDLSVLIDSQIDCEFQSSSSMSWAIGKLRHHVSCSKKPMYHIHWGSQGFTKCQPRMNHKHAWDGGECPLPEGIMVMPHYRKPLKLRVPVMATDLQWDNWGVNDDIIHFEVLEKLADGYVMPYEVSYGS